MIYFYDLYLFYSILVDMIPTTTASPPPTEPRMTITSQSTPATSTEPAEASTTTPPTTTSADAPGTTAPTQAPVSISVAPITVDGTNTVGESYCLECSVTVAGSTDQPTITWLVNNAEISSDAARTVSMTSGSAGRYSSTLTFNPLAASHVGAYTCRATLGSAADTASRAVNVQSKWMTLVMSQHTSSHLHTDPTITVSITSSAAAPIVGSVYSLTCAVTGAERLTDAMVTYTWSKNDALLSGQTMATLSFSSLTFSDAGSYTCQATVSSSLLGGPISPVSASPVSINPMCELYQSLYSTFARLITTKYYMYLYQNFQCQPCIYPSVV